MKARLITLLTAVLLLVSAGLAAAAPKAVAVEPKYEFPPMQEGRGLTHVFTIKNQGDTQLNIIGVYPP